ncbi:methyltransferase type 11 [Candidatus Giovannonibacteria bacterium RIFCSPHIGHO2_02_FULL_46_20]|uniref:Methyltransferase type 11 n=1 Tax=Candidatus Giovannonibacteria bacterium RIFCSPHIGHO2_02_FULL_46_20 TaxID=1798338 RepID=A0A1F5WEM1_9BACT|nr:MAG: methyltransferase type 11 [Candidatus Giovannonibacteria bacterium RIFCSPHIGHO2_02_FULL_46_20]
MIKNTQQIELWSGDFGNAYVDRNPQSVAELDALYEKDYGITRSALNEEFFGALDRNAKILEVGANIGLQLGALQRMGFKNLLGVEINDYAVSQAKKLHPEVDIIKGSAFDLPFRDNYFNLVYTSGVLIHIAPGNLPKAMGEIVRVSKNFVWGLEYFADEPTDIEYRGKKGFLWKRDFSAMYQELFPSLSVVKEKMLPMVGSQNSSQMFLLEKQ